MAYIDLFCGPGKYGDDHLSAPLLIIQSTLSNPNLINKMNFIFNDCDADNIASLKKSVAQMDVAGTLTPRIQYHSETIESNFHNRIKISRNVPVLSFVDPFGYKGLTFNFPFDFKQRL